MLPGARKGLIAAYENEGYLTRAEAENLLNLVDELKTDHPIVEIGVFAGKTTQLLGQYIQMTGRKNKVIGIDTFSYVPKHELNWPDLNIELIEGSSHDKKVIEKVKDISLLFIDGDHSEAAVIKDITNWLSKVREIVVFHDYYSPHHEHQVKIACDKANLTVSRGADTLAIMRVHA